MSDSVRGIRWMVDAGFSYRCGYVREGATTPWKWSWLPGVEANHLLFNIHVRYGRGYSSWLVSERRPEQSRRGGEPTQPAACR